MTASENGTIHLTSPRPVAEVRQQFLSILAAKGVTVFAVIDHSGEAAKIGMHMPDTKLIIFGNPKAGTPLMLSAPDSALDLPLKMLFAEAEDGSTRITYNAPSYLEKRYGLAPDIVARIGVIDQLAAALTK